MEQVALLFTDVEGSTRLIERSAAGYAANLRHHHEILRAETAREEGVEFFDAGDGLGFAFPEATAAVRAALAIQSALDSTEWPEPGMPFAVRMAVHWTPVELREGQYRGPGTHLVSRLLAAGHGGQVLASQACVEQLADLPGIRCGLLGTYRLRGFQGIEKIFQIEREGDAIVFPPLKADQARQSNLPARSGKFFGRKQELAEIRSRFMESASRVISLTGPGGIGKSRLALEAAEELLPSFDHGVYFVPLAGISDSAAIPAAILLALGVPPSSQTAPVAQIREVLRGAPTLLLLDNFEQFAAEGAAVLGQLLSAGENLAFLVTSRARIGISAEHEIALAAFPLPDPHESRPSVLNQYDCVQFFIDSARKVCPTRLLGTEDLSAIAEICRLVDGLPLALELVASRISTLTTAELKEQLSQNFHQSTSGNRLENAFEWSWQLLPPPAARLLERLSVFRGGWTVQSAAVVGNMPESQTQGYLHYLLTCSLIQAQEQSLQMRFNMLVPLREFAEARLGSERTACYRRHIRFFRELVKRTSDQLYTDQGPRLQEIVNLESENALAALVREKSPARRLADAVEFHTVALHSIYNRTLRQLLIATIPLSRRIKPMHRAIAYHAVATLDAATGDYISAYEYYNKALAGLENCGRPDDAVRVKYNLAVAASQLGDRVKAREIYLECLSHFRKLGNKQACAVILSSLGRQAFEDDEFSQARDFFQESLLAHREVNDLVGVAGALCGLGETLIELNQPEIAARFLVESVEVKLKAGKHLAIPHSFYALAKISLHGGDAQMAGFLYGIAEAETRKFQITLEIHHQRYVRAISERIGAILGEGAFEEMRRQGSQLQAAQWLPYLHEKFLQTAKIPA